MNLEMIELTIGFLEELSERFSCDGCNDFVMSNTPFNQEMCMLDGEMMGQLVENRPWSPDYNKELRVQNGIVVSNLIAEYKKMKERQGL